MNTRELAKKLVAEHKLPKAEKYDLTIRDYDGMIEVIGYMQDPTADMENFRGREMLFPKRWVTIAVFDPETEVSVA
jgi:hypothetical protein